MAQSPRQAVSAVNADRHLYIYFCRPCSAQTAAKTITEDEQNCFIAGDYRPEAPGIGLLNLDDMKRYLKRTGPPEIVIFLDCCRSEMPLTVGRPYAAFSDQFPHDNHLRLGVGRATQNAAVAYEVPIGAPKPSRGAFTQLLTYGLRELRSNGQLTLQELDVYVTKGPDRGCKAPQSGTRF